MRRFICLIIIFLLLLTPVYGLNNDDKIFFEKVHNVPYYTNGSDAQLPYEFWMSNKGDCDDKAIAYADYLNFKGYNVKIVTRQGNIGTHSFILYNNSIYDPTFGYYDMNPIIYNTMWSLVCPNGYIDMSTDYKPQYDYAVLCELMSK